MNRAAPSLALLTPRAMALADRWTVESGTAGIELMARAGERVAERARDLWDGGRILVLTGPGNNGGDGFVAAARLAAWGFDVEVRALTAPDALRGDAAWAAGTFDDAVLDWDPVMPLAGIGLVVDALFGAGLARALPAAVTTVLARIAAAGLPVLAVDLPSGVDGATGAIHGAAPEAVETVTFGRAKPGHHLWPGAGRTGVLRVADIGLDPAALERAHAVEGGPIWANAPALWRHVWPSRTATSHKYRHGHAVVVAGGIETGGAGRLAARAALAGGAGLVTLAAPAGAVAIHAARLDAVMVRAVRSHDLAPLLADDRRNAWLLGPGGGVGEVLRSQVTAVLAAGRATVLDADALTSFAGHIDDLGAAIQGPCVLTPHQGEARRLGFGGDDRIGEARALAARTGAVVLSKGVDSIVAAPDGRVAIAVNGCPKLATAGSGDVLGGVVLAGLAQGMPPFEAAAFAVWLHNEAAARGPASLTADDLPGLLHRALTVVAAIAP